MSRPSTGCGVHLNPHFAYDKGVAEDHLTYSNLYKFSDTTPKGSLPFHPVPSTTLHAEEMLVRGFTSPSHQIPLTNNFSRGDTERSSVATLVDFAEWISGQSHGRSPSLLPPAPRLTRLPPVASGPVECRLSSSPPLIKDYDQSTAASRGSTPRKLSSLSAQLEDISLTSDGISTTSTRPITPVPSLTNSNYSGSSIGTPDHSSPLVFRSPTGHSSSFLTNRTCRDMATATKESLDGLGASRRIRNVSSPLPSPSLYQDSRCGWTTLPADPSRHSSYLPSRPVPSPEINTTTVHLPQPSQHSQEISFIDWDDGDGKRGDSALVRLKKSFTDLRAAERYIADASSRRKLHQNGEHQHAHATLTTYQRRPSACSIPSSPIPYSSDQTTTVSHRSARAKLSKKLSTKNMATSPSQQQHIATLQPDVAPALPALPNLHDTATVPSTPPSTGKRKRTSTLTSQRSQGPEKKKAKNGVVRRLVHRLLRTKKDL